MFLKKLLAIATKSETLVHTTSTYAMYDTTFENKNATKLVFAQSPEAYSFLKKIKHDTIIGIYKLNVEKKYLVTRRLFPFCSMFRKEAKEFNKYIFLKMAEALMFLHDQCGTIHRNIVKDSLFFSEEGNIVLGGFEKSRKSGTFDEDSMMFSNLLNELVGIDVKLEDFVKNRGFCSDIFFDLEIAFFGYKSFTAEQKLDFISKTRKSKDEFIDIHKRRIAWMVLGDISTNAQKDFKILGADFILCLDVPNMEEFLSPLFSILDTDVRLYLLRNPEKYIGRVTSLDPIIKSLSLGIKCKDKQLREETIVFVKENVSMISKKQQSEILETMCEYVSDDQGMHSVLKFLHDVRPIFKKTDVVYRILCKYLIQSKSKVQVLHTMEIFYETFDNFKMTAELLPLLCGYLSNRHAQPAVFSLIEKILAHLKEHKTEIIDREWKIGSIKNIFRFKSSAHQGAVCAENGEAQLSKPQNESNRKHEEYDNDQSDGWDDPW
ncbi:hypothetical protein EHEL_090160 [Encephalitozoon hellem ATCC 50504]|uniref:Cytoplasmic export protein n=1 Tax=Encephalitozoon hellem TaxID=27973 RepID=A0A9Q9CDH3_ENCHE|nr:uncharacterized protein EHEL_090160 [Encephalitozoon hellem ATCC 50504]AFM98912.1 hypothetical protein EHEL_090160 [Encephalitozoon hellem ATCC 50504]UTX43924.1 cytoplasmic export protein [Encephalitozoon hellem]WEL39408.1 cytoplasmic export protein [Encephalitozoon hellem]|eukprot:XP_003887893.1 hypothetical protein EHEL_090160 [Encephalitozoon hellem ATCC 50504]